MGRDPKKVAAKNARYAATEKGREARKRAERKYRQTDAYRAAHKRHMQKYRALLRHDGGRDGDGTDHLVGVGGEPAA